jgi:signal transduction histidine kinase
MRACALVENFLSFCAIPATTGSKRVMNAIPRRIRGTGLGLTYGIVRAAKEKHKIWHRAEGGKEGVVGITRS